MITPPPTRQEAARRRADPGATPRYSFLDYSFLELSVVAWEPGDRPRAAHLAPPLVSMPYPKATRASQHAPVVRRVGAEQKAKKETGQKNNKKL